VIGPCAKFAALSGRRARIVRRFWHAGGGGRLPHNRIVPWLPMYLLNDDVSLLVDRLDNDAGLAWLAPNGPGRWIATAHHPPLVPRMGLWHAPSGPLPLHAADAGESDWIHDPWSGWQERRVGRDPSTPYFGAGHPGVYWLNLRTDPDRPRKTAEIGLSSFEWIGNHYRPIGKSADPSTQRHWRALSRWLGRVAVKIPRAGDADGPGPEIFAFPGALAAVEAGTSREANPF
jgi:hypothetical protein